MYGEENDTIKNNKDQDVTIQVGDTVEETFRCLSVALDDDLEAARSLAEASHREFALQDLDVDSFPPEEDEKNFDLENIGVWIDPIGITVNSYY